MKKRFLSILTGLYVFTLFSCGSTPRIINKEIDCKDSMVFSDVKVVNVVNEKETIGETGSAENLSHLSFQYQKRQPEHHNIIELLLQHQRHL